MYYLQHYLDIPDLHLPGPPSAQLSLAQWDFLIQIKFGFFHPLFTTQHLLFPSGVRDYSPDPHSNGMKCS